MTDTCTALTSIQDFAQTFNIHNPQQKTPGDKKANEVGAMQTGDVTNGDTSAQDDEGIPTDAEPINGDQTTLKSQPQTSKTSTTAETQTTADFQSQ